MAISPVTVTFSLYDFLGFVPDTRRTKVVLTTNVGSGFIADTSTGGGFRITDTRVTISSAGVASFSVLPSGATGLNPAAYQIRVQIDAANPATRQRAMVDLGYYTITAACDLKDLVAAQYVPPTYLSSVTTTLDAKVTAAAGSATAAAASAALATSISGISTSDGVVTTLVNNPASTTAAALLASISAAIAAAGDGVLVPPPEHADMYTPTRTFNVARFGIRAATSDYDIDADRPPAGVTYYASPTGTYGAAGTLVAPCTLAGARDKSDVGTIRLVRGSGGERVFWRDNSLEQLGKSVNVIADPADQLVVSGWANPTGLTGWTVQSGNIYKLTVPADSGPYNPVAQVVADFRPGVVTAWNDAPVYTQKANLAGVTAAGQWAQVGTTLYVWALGNANLASDASFLRVSLDGKFTGIVVTATNTRVYCEGFEFQACGWLSQSLSTIAIQGGGAGPHVILLKNMRSRYGVIAGFRGHGCSWFAAVDCQTSSNQDDGFSFQSAFGQQLHGILVNTKAYRNFSQDPTSNVVNGYTGHDECYITTVNPGADHNQGPQFVFVNGAKAWVIGGTGMKNSTAPDNYGKVGYQVYGGSVMFLDAPLSDGNFIGYEARAGSALHIRDEQPGNNPGIDHENNGGTGVIDTY